MPDLIFQVQLQLRGAAFYNLRGAVATARALARRGDVPLVLITEPGREEEIVLLDRNDLDKYYTRKEIHYEPLDNQDGDLLAPHGGGRGSDGQGAPGDSKHL